VADAVKTTGNSPWDEPVPENTKTIKPTPTVVGDLDVNKSQENLTANQEAKPIELKIPTDTEEKVGVKIDATAVQPAVTQPEPTVPPAPAPTKEPTTNSKNSNFWQSVYSQEGKPEGVAQATPPAPRVDIGPKPTTPVTPPKILVETSRLGQPAPANPASVGQVPIKPAQTAPVPPPTTPPPAAQFRAPVNRTKTFIFAGILGVIILFAGGIFLTEQGMISLGLEKIYGIAHLESLWKGLPENPENAFAMAASKMKTEKSFKVNGSATVTINRGVKSDIISPIVSAVAYPIMSFKAVPAGRQDEELGSYIEAVLTALNDGLAGEVKESPDNSPKANVGIPTESVGKIAAESGTTGGSTSSSMIASVEEVTAELSARIADDVSGAKIDLKSKKSPNSKIELVYSSGKMYLKTSDDIVYDKSTKGGWLAYNLKNFGQESPQDVLWGSDFSGSNFSIIGQRSGNETIDGVRCYHYVGKVTLGSALNGFGLSENSLSSMDSDFWLGAKDHLIHRLKMKIVSNSSAAISRIEVTLDFSDYGGGGGDFVVPATSTPASGGASQTGGTQPTPSQAATMTAEQLRDTQRKSDLSNIAKALESYFAAFGKYPITTKTEKISQTTGILYSTLVPSYITTLPIDPLDPKYYYGYESNGTQYSLSAVLEDKTDPDGKTVGSSYLYFLKNQ